jgi:hypothetical protein
MDPPLMLLGFNRAVSRFMGYEPADARQAMRLAFAEPLRPDLLDVVLDELAANDGSRNDLDEELLTHERYLALFEALNWGCQPRRPPDEGLAFRAGHVRGLLVRRVRGWRPDSRLPMGSEHRPS